MLMGKLRDIYVRSLLGRCLGRELVSEEEVNEAIRGAAEGPNPLVRLLGKNDEGDVTVRRTTPTEDSE